MSKREKLHLWRLTVQIQHMLCSIQARWTTAANHFHCMNTNTSPALGNALTVEVKGQVCQRNSKHRCQAGMYVKEIVHPQNIEHLLFICSHIGHLWLPLFNYGNHGFYFICTKTTVHFGKHHCNGHPVVIYFCRGFWFSVFKVFDTIKWSSFGY